MKLSAGRIPPTDGESHWRFPVVPGVMLRAKGKQELIDLVFQYRLRANMPVGDVGRDISDFYCKLYPGFCHAERADIDPGAPRISSEPMLNRVSQWASVLAHRQPRGGYDLVSKDEAERRAAICVQCPKQATDWRGGCGGCSAITMQLLQAIKKLKTTPRDGNLGACSIAGWYNGSAIWLSNETLEITTDMQAAMPDGCWRKAVV